uniref:Uncharacterized protein n=1 Tax=Aegilops tauschii subsp. strangulata TaxID=200361 RepID=A0A453QR96_AEGTS
MSTDGRWCYIVLGVAASRRAGPWTGTSSRSGWWSFVRTALEQTRLRTALTPHPSQEKFRLIRANDDATVLDALSFSARKIRLLHSLTVEKKNYVQVLHLQVQSFLDQNPPTIIPKGYELKYRFTCEAAYI